MRTKPDVAAQFPDGLQDPCPKYCLLMEQFVTWYFKARKSRHTESSIWEVAELGMQLQADLKETFPDSSGM